ncbi:MAG: hypothetical protein IPP66_15155 [Anaerolineales bacterium]|nr:hypothetical protein [Anaerolineales bacterium]
MPSTFKIHRPSYLGLFTTTLATLMFENLLTRIFSVTMWYHFAFMAVSIAMFGMTLGAIIVYLSRSQFTPERIKKHLATTALLFSITIIISFLIHINVPINSWTASIYLPLTFVLISIPFIFAGINTCLILTKAPTQIGKLYAADLAGAAVGCILFIYILEITDGPTAVFITAFIASLGAVFYSIDVESQFLKRVTQIGSIFLLIFVFIQMTLGNNQPSLIRLKWIKGGFESAPILEKWNSFSRVRVYGEPNTPRPPFGWGISQVYPQERTTNYVMVDIDSHAGTPIASFDGNFDKVDYLKFDVTNMVHYIRKDADVLVIGAGGGRDILSALAFGQHSVTGVEINENIIEILTQDYGEYSGHLDKYPNVNIVNDEARSYIARSEKKYDIIQVSLIDTWAATASGAFVLTENSLYTTEGWDIFFQHIKPNGIITFSRWYFNDLPSEMYRLTVLASKALQEQGIENPRNHILIIRNAYTQTGDDLPDGVGTILVSLEPFTSSDIKMIEETANKMDFDVILTPDYAADTNFEHITSTADADAFIANFPLNITAPTDNNPFFFQMLRLQDFLNASFYSQGVMGFNIIAVNALGILLVTVILLSLIFIISPILLTSKKLTVSKNVHTIPLSIFFACIGLGFMLIEISQLQRLTVFLGHPTYSLSVVLFSLLLSSGIGSFLTPRASTNLISSIRNRMLALLCVISLFGLVTPSVIGLFDGAITPVRIFIAVLILFPMGLFMGMAFPIGMNIASGYAESLTPWFWGTNGSMSVVASVLTVVISINSGISTSFWVGFGCYLIAFISIFLLKNPVHTE